jgi:hypothetical protein
MSFLDSLENNLKAVEANEPSGLDDQQRRQNDKQRALAAAPWAEKLRVAPYTQTLMQQVSRGGYQIRTKVNIVWLSGMLRLEARGHRLEFRPTAEGILAVQLKGSDETKRELIDLAGAPEALLDGWMAVPAEQKKEDDAAAAQSLLEEE